MSKCLVDESLLYDSINRLATNAIFLESSNPKIRDKYPPSYTLKLYDVKLENGNVLPSAYKVYMEAVDEYDAAIKLVGNMANWDILCKLNWFMNGKKQPAVSHIGLKTWREHKLAKIKSEAMAVLQDKVKEGDTTASKAVLAEIKEKPVGKATRNKKPSVEAPRGLKTDQVNDFLLKRIK